MSLLSTLLLVMDKPCLCCLTTISPSCCMPMSTHFASKAEIVCTHSKFICIHEARFQFCKFFAYKWYNVYAFTCCCRLDGLQFSLHQTLHTLISSKLFIWKRVAVFPNVCHLTRSFSSLYTYSVNELTSANL